MLFVNDCDSQILVPHLLLKNCMGPDQNIDRTIHQSHQGRFANLALVASGEDREIDRKAVQQFLQTFIMLTRQYFCRSQKRALISGFYSGEQRHQRHQRLSRANIALQQSQHRSSLREVPLDFADTAFLGIGQFKRQFQLVSQAPVPLNRDAFLAAVAGTDQHEGQLIGKNLVIGQSIIGTLAFRTVESSDTILPTLPFLRCKLAWLYPFRQFRRKR